jgi:hypothetical protein
LDTRFIRTGSNVSFNGIRASGQVWINDTLGRVTNVNNLIQHLEDFSSNTLLDKSRGSLSCVGGVLNYTLYAIDGVGDWNFNGTIYAGPGVSVANATIILTCGTNITPKVNQIYWELVGNVPILKVSESQPTGVIHTAEFLVGSCSGSSYTIYSYSRHRDEIDSFIKRTIDRIQSSGTLYVSGFGITTPTTKQINIGSGDFFTGIFEMYTNVSLNSSLEGFYIINSTGNFNSYTSFDGATFNQYQTGETITDNRYINVVWGIVPTTTTSSKTIPTIPKLVAIVQSKPATEYNSIALAEQDTYGTTNYYPTNNLVKEVFVPIARTVVLRRTGGGGTGTLQTLSNGKLFRNIAGGVSSSGAASSSSVNYWTESGNVLSTTTGTYQVKVNELSINNTNYLYNAISAVGNINNYFQFNIRNQNISPSASSDLVATSPIGSETSYYVDLGINGPTYNDTNYAATKGNDSYLLTINSSLIIGTGSTNKYISFFVNSFMTPIWVMNITSTGLNMFKNLDMGSNNITNVSYIKLNEISGACDLTINGSICKNSSGLYITG